MTHFTLEPMYKLSLEPAINIMRVGFPQFVHVQTDETINLCQLDIEHNIKKIGLHEAYFIHGVASSQLDIM